MVWEIGVDGLSGRDDGVVNCLEDTFFLNGSELARHSSLRTEENLKTVLAIPTDRIMIETGVCAQCRHDRGMNMAACFSAFTIYFFLSFSHRRAVVRYTAYTREQQIRQDQLSSGEEEGAVGGGLHGEEPKRAQYDHVCGSRSLCVRSRFLCRRMYLFYKLLLRPYKKQPST